jgi:hypothetical protein
MNDIKNPKRRHEVFSKYSGKKYDSNWMLDYLSKYYLGCRTDDKTTLSILNRLVDEYSIDSIVTSKEYFEILREAFTGYDRPKSLQADQCYEELFYNKSPTTLLMNDEELDYFNSLPDTIKIYRGYRMKRRSGLSWTLDRKIAEFYAYSEWHRRIKAPGTVVSIIVPKKEVFAYVNEREEHEIITPLYLQKKFKIESSST